MARSDPSCYSIASFSHRRTGTSGHAGIVSKTLDHWDADKMSRQIIVIWAHSAIHRFNETLIVASKSYCLFRETVFFFFATDCFNGIYFASIYVLLSFFAELERPFFGVDHVLGLYPSIILLITYPLPGGALGFGREDAALERREV